MIATCFTSDALWQSWGAAAARPYMVIAAEHAAEGRLAHQIVASLG